MIYTCARCGQRVLILRESWPRKYKVISAGVDMFLCQPCSDELKKFMEIWEGKQDDQ